MVMKKVLVCPKCGSKDIEFHQRGSRGDHRECLACGYIGNFNEELVDDLGEEMWP